MSTQSSSRKPSPSSNIQSSNWDQCQLGEDENSGSTYLDCHNQLHYIEKYHEKTGRSPPGMGLHPAPLLPDGGSETDDSEPAMSTERTKTPAQVSPTFLFILHLTYLIYWSKEISYSNCGIQTTPGAHRDRKRKRHIDDFDDHSEKENVPALSIIPTTSIGNAKRLRKDQQAVNLLQNAVRLSQKAVVLSQEAISMSERAVGLLDSEN